MGKLLNSADDLDRFDLHGPKDLMDLDEIDWAKEEHRRRVAACLVKGVYVHENDRAERRAVKLAPAWWESFGFHLKKELREPIYSAIVGVVFDTIYGAIFEYSPSAPGDRCAPRYVVAFRGTKPGSIRDYYLDLKIVINKLKKRTRCVQACATIEGLMMEEGQDSCIWLAGHSLGAAVALVVGRYMMVQEKPPNLPTFLFNPLHVSFITSINLLKLDPVAKERVHRVGNILREGAAKVLRSHRERMDNLFQRLSPWVPNLYVHKKDPICQGFIDYFEQRQKFMEGSHRVGTTFAALSLRDGFWHLIDKDKDRPQLLPSAKLWKSCLDHDPHGLQQWWKQDSLEAKHYSYPVPQAQTASTSMPA
ncbi:GDSL esterase/lipase At4g10955-like [Triticum dicoccoides]|uniref:GDSL esterase/lipase At4g10955-like n=1 Tax=Triticum dicoccoides TaxID=85692 RepID=UPI00188E2E15|nr:GDSL esterase/lipase At4g10955-like [Triticum dicoccoides]